MTLRNLLQQPRLRRLLRCRLYRPVLEAVLVRRVSLVFTRLSTNRY